MKNSKKRSTVPATVTILFCCCLLAPQITAKAAAVPQDYISWWKFEADANDETGTNNGTLTNGASTAYNSGRQGQVLVLDGLNDYVDVGNFDIVGSGLTISAWIKSDNLIDQSRIISKTISSTEQDHYWMLGTYDSSGMKLRFRVKTDGTTTTLVASTGTLPQGQWIHVVGVYDGNDMILYKDGAEVGRTAKTGSVSTNNGVAVNIGRNPDGHEFEGLIDDMMIFGRALSVPEISAIYQAGNQSAGWTSVCDMVGYWKLDELVSGDYEDSASDNNGVCAGVCPVPNVNGRVDGMQVFDGSTTGIDIPADAIFNWDVNDSFSIVFWVKRDTPINGSVTNDNEVIVGRDDAATDLHWWFGMQYNGKARFQIGDKSGSYVGLDGPAIDDGQWHHVVGIRDGVNKVNHLYVDGVDVNSIPYLIHTQTVLIQLLPH